MPKITAKHVHPRFCASNSVLAVGYVWRQPGVPHTGSGKSPPGSPRPETTPEQPGEPPKMDLQGVDGVEEARARTPPALPSTPSLLRCGGGAAERRYCWA